MSTKSIIGHRSGGAIGYCIGRNGSRVRQLSLYLGGERISFVEANAQRSTQILQALSPAKLKVEDIQLESNDNGVQHAHILAEEEISHVLGKHGVNLRLARELLNIKIYCDPKEAKK